MRDDQAHTHAHTHVMLAYAAFVEAPYELQRRVCAGECIVHENGVVGMDDVELAAIVVAARRAKRALRCAFKHFKEGKEWIVVPRREAVEGAGA